MNKSAHGIKAFFPWIQQNYPWLLLLLIFFSFTFGELYRQMITLMALVGIYQIIRDPKQLITQPAIKMLLVLFLCLWLPILASLIGTGYPVSSGMTALRYLMYLLAGVAMIRLLARTDMLNRLAIGVMLIMLCWSLDGLLQFFAGQNILGYPYLGYRVTGVFHPSPRIGIVLAILAPVYFEAIRHLSLRNRWAWLLLLPLIAVILLAGSRSSWILLAAALAGYGAYYVAIAAEFRWVRLLLRGAAVMGLAVFIVMQVGWLEERVRGALNIVSSNYDEANLASSNRLPLWNTALNMASQNWLNGVGVRAFHYAYNDYAGQGDPFRDLDPGHPHLLVLEIAAETGLIGITGYLLFLGYLIKKIISLKRSARSHAIPWGVAVIVAAFPLSAGIPFYAHFLSGLTWLPLIVFLSMYDVESKANTS
ncbi:MAG TPA: O-antigen ligase family protein [Gammaproteobacteria bacterium]